MSKIKFDKWISIIPVILIVAFIGFAWILTGFNTVLFYVLAVLIMLAFYILTYIFEPFLFEYGEEQLESDVELLKLEKENAALLWAFAGGMGIAFLLPGIQKIADNPTEAIIGLTFLIVGNLIYYVYYNPRYSLLVRKRKIELDLQNHKRKRKNE